jgi:hypothetical protein
MHNLWPSGCKEVLLKPVVMSNQISSKVNITGNQRLKTPLGETEILGNQKAESCSGVPKGAVIAFDDSRICSRFVISTDFHKTLNK